MDCPCTKCENKGCGTYHDKCKPYKEYVKYRKDNKADLNKRYDFTRKVRKIGKNHRGWDHQQNIGY